MMAVMELSEVERTLFGVGQYPDRVADFERIESGLAEYF